MNMPIQRQSESFGIFDDGPRFARDRSSTELPRGLAGILNTGGPRIQAGLLNTRQAGFPMDSPYGLPGPRDHGGAGPDGGPALPDWYYDGDSEDDDDEYAPDSDPERFVPENFMDYPDRTARRGSGRHSFDRLAETILPRGSDQCQWCGDQKPTNRWQGAPSHDGVSLKSRSEDVCPDCVDAIPHKDEYQRFVDENHNGRHSQQAFNDFHNKTKMGSDDLWSWSNWMEGIQQQGHAAHDLEHAWESDLRNNRNGLDQLIRPYRWEASRHPFDRAAARRLAKDGDCTCWEGYERVPGTEPCASKSCRKKSMLQTASWFDGKPDHADAAWGETDEGWEHPVTGCRVRPSSRYLDEWEMVAPTTSKRKPYTIIDHHPDPQAMMDRHDRAAGYGPKTAQTEPTAMAPQMPAGGGFQPAHRVGLDWRDSTLRGTVIGVDDQVHVRWDDGQYTSEEPPEIRLL